MFPAILNTVFGIYNEYIWIFRQLLSKYFLFSFDLKLKTNEQDGGSLAVTIYSWAFYTFSSLGLNMYPFQMKCTVFVNVLYIIN